MRASNEIKWIATLTLILLSDVRAAITNDEEPSTLAGHTLLEGDSIKLLVRSYLEKMEPTAEQSG